MEALGRHILVEFFQCNPDTLNDVQKIEKSMVDAAVKSNATVINSDFHHFSPYGVSGVVVIQESHLALHTWPEYQYAAADLFTCGDDVDPWLAFDHLKEQLHAESQSVLEMYRGPINLLNRIPYNAPNYREIAYERAQKIAPKRSIWFTDKDENIALSVRTTGDVLYDKSSDLQRVRVFNSSGFGKMLTIDNMIMCTEKDESHYHEMISHPAVFIHGNAKNVLVIGGGDGGTVRELLRHKSIEKITMVEIDQNVIEASRKHLVQLSSGFDDPRLDLRIEDGIKFVENSSDDFYDIVIVDGSDPVGPAQGLFSEDFYRNTRRILKKEGILVTQGESPVFNHAIFADLNKCLQTVFGKDNTKVMLFNIATYPSGIWSFQIAAKSEQDFCKIDRNKLSKFVKENNLNYYNADIHKAAFLLPNYILKLIK